MTHILNRSPEPALIAVAVVVHDGRVLIGRRPAGLPLAGFWEFPGGKMAPGETPSEAAERECHEETGLEVAVVGTYGVEQYDYTHGPVRIHFLAAAPRHGDRRPREPFRWVPVAELHRYRFPPANQRVLKELLGRGPVRRPSAGSLQKNQGRADRSWPDG